MTKLNNAQPWQILLIDENEEHFQFTRNTLSGVNGRPIRVDWATSYQEGHEKACASYYDAIIVADPMGHEQGLHLIQECSRIIAAPFIFLCSHDSDDMDRQAMQAGAIMSIPRDQEHPALLEHAVRHAITRNQHEQELITSERLWREMIESETSKDLILYADSTGAAQYANPALRNYTGLSIEEINHTGWQAFTHPEDRERMRVEWTDAAVKGEPLELELRFRKSDGSYHWFSVHGWPVKDNEGQIQKWISILRDITERKSAEEALRESRKRTMEILESITDGFFELDRDWRFTYINHLAALNIGHDPSELLGRTIWEMFPEIQGTEQEASYRKVMEERQPVYIELKGVRTSRWYEYRIYPSTAGITVYWTDIHERKETESALHESDQREHTRAAELQAVIDALPAYVWITHDRDARVMIGNKASYTLVDAPEGENISKTGGNPEKVRRFRAMRDGKDIPPEDLPVQVVARTGQPLTDYEFDIEVNGEVRHLFGNVSPLLDENGEPAGAVSAFMDITERKVVEARLYESESRFRVTLSSAPITVYTTDCELRITWMHDPHPGFDPQEVIGKTLDQVVAGEVAEQLTELQQTVLETGQSAQGEVSVVVENEEIYYAYYIAPIFDKAEKIVGLACAGYDISNLKQAEQELQHYAAELERSNNAMKDFSSIASHDLQEPLRKIQAFGLMLEDRFSAQLGEEGKDYIDRMTSASQRMQSMLQSLLAYSRITSRAAPFTEIDLNRIIGEVISDLEVRLMQTSGQVESCDLPVVQADPAQMRQLFQNLIGNALKYHRPDLPPRVKITCSPAGKNQFEIHVQDNGIGFDMRYAEHIFDPFVRLNGKAGVEGSGMGLTICKKIVERHGGRIAVASAPGKGSTFTVVLPIQQK